MQTLIERQDHCPYCGEMIDILIDHSVIEQTYIEDCFMCCQPIMVNVSLDQEGIWIVVLSNENE